MKKLVLVSLLALIAPLLKGQITLVAWDFGTTSISGGTASSSFSNSHANITVNDFTLGGGAVASTQTGIFAATGFPPNTTRAEYLSFSFNVTTGSLDLHQIQFDVSRSVAGNSANRGPRTFDVTAQSSSINGGNETLVGSTDAWASTSTGTFASLGPFTFATPDFDNVSGIVEIRIYGLNTSGNGETNHFGGIGDGAVGNDLVLTGYVIPEPSTYALIFGGVSLLGVLVWKRRARSKELAA